MRAVFRCIAGCDGDYAVSDVIYRCPRCGGLLEVVHDLAALRAAGDGGWWKQQAADRAGESSGVWRWRECVLPQLPADAIVTLGEGRTHLTPVPRHARELGVGALWVKQCGTSHSGSFKDLGMTVLVSQVHAMIRAGARIRAIACASTGDTSAALAAYAAAAGIPAVVILPKGKISTAQLVQPLAMGATVLALATDFDGCMAIVQRLAADDGIYLANSMNSLRLEGQKTVAFEIAEQLGWTVPDWVVIPGGNLGNVSALHAGFAMLAALGVVGRLPRLCVAQAANAAPLYDSCRNDYAPLVAVAAKPTLASAIQIGNPVSFAKAVRALKATSGTVEVATEAELADASARADRHGLFTCPHTGVALAAATKLAARGVITARDRVVVVATASGLKFADVKAGYHDGRLADVPAPRHRNTPIELPASYEAVREAVDRLG
jgi:threonine synthase